jgi:hypothetical protein
MGIDKVEIIELCAAPADCGSMNCGNEYFWVVDEAISGSGKNFDKFLGTKSYTSPSCPPASISCSIVGPSFPGGSITFPAIISLYGDSNVYIADTYPRNNVSPFPFSLRSAMFSHSI